MECFAALPVEVERASRVDGFSRVRSLLHVFPMAAPGIATAFIMSVLMAYSEFMFAMILTMGTPAATFPAMMSGLFYMDIAVPKCRH